MLPTSEADAGRRDEVLDDDAVLEHGDLGVARALVRRFGADLVAHHHDAFDGLAAGQELGLGQDRRAAAAGVAAVAAALPLGLQPGRTADALDLVGRSPCPTLRPSRAGRARARRCSADRRVSRGVAAFAGAGLAPPPAPAPPGRAVAAGRLVVARRRSSESLRRPRPSRRTRRRSVVVGSSASPSGSPPRPRPRPRRPRRRRRLAGRSAWSSSLSSASARRRRVFGVVVLVVVLVFVVVVTHGGPRRDGLRRDEQRQVVGRCSPRGLPRRARGSPAAAATRAPGVQPLEVLDDHYRFGVDWRRVPAAAAGSAGRRPAGPGRQHVADPYGVGAVHAGMRAAGAAVELARARRAPAGWWSPAPAPASGPSTGRAGPRRPASRLPGGMSARFGEVVGLVLDWGIVGHVFSSSPRARHVDAATRGLPLCARMASPGLVMVSPRAALSGTHSVPGLNDGWDGRRRIAVAVVALVKVFIRVFAAGMTTYTLGQYPIPLRVPGPGCDCRRRSRQPASDGRGTRARFRAPRTPGNRSRAPD